MKQKSHRKKLQYWRKKKKKKRKKKKEKRKKRGGFFFPLVFFKKKNLHEKKGPSVDRIGPICDMYLTYRKLCAAGVNIYVCTYVRNHYTLVTHTYVSLLRKKKRKKGSV